MIITIDLPEDTLAAIRADAGSQGRPIEQVAAERLSVLYMAEDEEQAAVEEALNELEAGQGRSFAEFSQEFSARFVSRYRTA